MLTKILTKYINIFYILIIIINLFNFIICIYFIIRKKLTTHIK